MSRADPTTPTNGVEKSLLKRAMGFEYEETIEMYAGRGTNRRARHFIKSVTILLNKGKRLRGTGELYHVINGM